MSDARDWVVNRRSIALVAIVGMLVGACQSTVVSSATVQARSPVSITPAAIDWAALARAVQIPHLAPGAACPRSSGRHVSAAYGIALGEGPVYPIGLADGVLSTYAVDGTYRQKVLWVSAASYQGPVLIRGARLDGSDVVQFSTGDSGPTSEFRLLEPGARSSNQEAGWREWPSYTTVPRLGCYGYQVDGTSFSSVIVFEARIGA